MSPNLVAPTWTPPTVENLVILVTGASSGIGRATSLLLAAAGASVGLLDVNKPSDVEQLINKTFGPKRAIAVACDVRDPERCIEATQEVVAVFGRLDGAANLAGVIGKGRKIGTTQGQLKDMETSEWNRVVDINLGGVKNCIRAQLPYMSERGASIVNAASIVGQAGAPFNSAYAASKAGVISLTKSVAKEVGSQNIRINAIAPGVVDTPLIADMAPDNSTKAAFGAKCALGRCADPEEIAKLVIFLLTDHSSYCTGAIFNIDGGW